MGITEWCEGMEDAWFEDSCDSFWYRRWLEISVVETSSFTLPLFRRRHDHERRSKYHRFSNLLWYTNDGHWNWSVWDLRLRFSFDWYFSFWFWDDWFWLGYNWARFFSFGWSYIRIGRWVCFRLSWLLLLSWLLIYRLRFFLWWSRNTKSS